jgi:Ca2+-binding EF-hand superfamily protein
MRISALIAVSILAASIAATASAQTQSGPGPVLTQEKREAAFDAADANHDGALSLTEFAKTIPSSISSTTEAQFNRRDANHTGSLSKAEYSAVLTAPGGG